MDTIDFKVFFQACFRYYGPASAENRRPDFKRIGAEVGLSQSEVESRILRFEEINLIRGYIAIPNVSLLLGYKLRTYLLPFPDPLSKGSAAADLMLIDDIIRIDEYLNSIAFTILYKGDADIEQSLSKVAKLSGKAALSQEPLLLHESKADVPGEQLPELHAIDWKVIRALRSDSLKSPEILAMEVGAPVDSTVRSLKKLVDSNLLLVVPVTDEQKLASFTLYALLFIPDGSTDLNTLVERLASALSERTYYRILSPSGAVIFLMSAKDSREAEASYLRAQKILGVKVALIDYAGETYHSLKSIDRVIEEQAKRQ